MKDTESGKRTVKDLSDAELTALGRDCARETREAGFRELYDRHASYLMNRLQYNRRMNRADAQDLAARAWKRVWAHLHRFEPDRSKFRTWLTTIANNLVKNWYRNRDRDPQTNFSRLESSQGRDDRPRDWEDPDAQPVRKARQRELQAIVAETMEQLRDHLRLVLELRESEGMSYEAIAEETGLPLGTVKSRIHRARRALGRRLATPLSDRPELLPKHLRDRNLQDIA